MSFLCSYNLLLFRKSSTLCRCKVPSWEEDNYMCSSGVYQCFSTSFFEAWPQGCFKAQQAACVVYWWVMLRTALVNGIPERNGGTIIQQCSSLPDADIFWKYFDFLIVTFLAVTSFLCHMTSRENITYSFFLQDLREFFLPELWYYLPQSQMRFKYISNLVWQPQISDPWRLQFSTLPSAPY